MRRPPARSGQLPAPEPSYAPGGRTASSVVEALRGQLFGSVGPDPNLHVDRVAIGLEGVEGEQGEATVGDDLLVDGLVIELGRRGDGTGHHRRPPDQGHGPGAAVLAAPTTDDVVVEVDLPVGVVLGEDVGEVGLGAQVARAATLGLDVGDMAEELELPLGPRGPGAAGDPDAAAPGPLGKPIDVAAGFDARGQLLVVVARLAKRSRELLGEAPVGIPSWVLSAMKRGIGRGFGVTGPA